MKLFLERLAYAKQLLTRQFYPYKGLIVLLLFIAIAKIISEISLAVMLIPLLNEILEQPADDALPEIWFQFVDWAQTTFQIESITALAFIILITIAIVRCIFAVGYFYLMNYIKYSFENHSRTRIFRLITNLDWLYYTRQKMGNIVNAPLQETNRASTCFQQLIITMDGVLTVIFFLTTAIVFSPLATGIAILAMLLIGSLVIPLAYLARKYGRILVQSRNSMLHHLGEFVNALKVVKGSRMEEAANRLIQERSHNMRKYYLKVGILQFIPNTLVETAAILAVLFLVFMIKYLELLALSQAAVIVILMHRGLNRISVLQHSWIQFSERATSLSAIDQLEKSLKHNLETRPQGSVERFDSLRFDHVWFYYAKNTPALCDMTLSIERGEFIGVVGDSGAGKTTFVDVFLGLLKPQQGTLYLNGKEFAALDPWAWRDLIGYVPQESLMFNDSVYNNISLFRENITETDVYAAARMADAEEFIASLPNGYQTIIGDRGMRLSGGQRQRIALARALAQKPQILLLDEATSSLDSISERRIQSAVDNLHGQITILSVAHRLSTVMGADRIVVLDQGRVSEIGPPNILITNQGKFNQLYTLQHQH